MHTMLEARSLTTIALCALSLCALLPGKSSSAATGPTGATSAGRGECRTLQSKILNHPVNYCALIPPGYDADKTRRYPVLYLLHGLGDNEQMLLRSGGFDMVQDLWENHSIGDYLIVTPNGGQTFYINSRDGRVRYEDFLVREFMPYIESHYRVRADRAHRAVGGISMGGYGALRLAFRHPDLFSSVVAHSAALIQSKDLPGLNLNGRAPVPEDIRLMGNLFGDPFDRAYYERNSPLVLARAANLSGLKIYFDCGAQDDYGFNVGAQALDETLTARHVSHEFHLYPGGHSWEYFAAHLPASLKFVSHAFGLVLKTQ
jgi:S-formylglutathione hydrolase FrmB